MKPFRFPNLPGVTALVESSAIQEGQKFPDSWLSFGKLDNSGWYLHFMLPLYRFSEGKLLMYLSIGSWWETPAFLLAYTSWRSSLEFMWGWNQRRIVEQTTVLRYDDLKMSNFTAHIS